MIDHLTIFKKFNKNKIKYIVSSLSRNKDITDIEMLKKL